MREITYQSYSPKEKMKENDPEIKSLIVTVLTNILRYEIVDTISNLDKKDKVAVENNIARLIPMALTLNQITETKYK